MDHRGNLDTTATLTGHELYRLHKSITARRNLSQIALGICEKQRNATLGLMEQVDAVVAR